MFLIKPALNELVILKVFQPMADRCVGDTRGPTKIMVPLETKDKIMRYQQIPAVPDCRHYTSDWTHHPVKTTRAYRLSLLQFLKFDNPKPILFA